MRLRQSQTTKLSLSSTLRSWLPILQADIESLEDTLEPFVKENPFIEVKSGFEKRGGQLFGDKSFTTDYIESLTLSQSSLYEVLQEQVAPPLFPTKKSQDIAFAVIEEINEQGYFEGDIKKIAKKFSCKAFEVEKVRLRFAYLEPIGVGAKDMKESFLFQLDDMEINEDIYKAAKKLIMDFENIQEYGKDRLFNEAINIIKKFSNPPAIAYLQESKQIIPDIFIVESENGIEVRTNDSFYPEIVLELDGLDRDNDYIKQKVKAAKDLIDALDMRKATIKKIGLMILEYQYEFFNGGDIKPMKLKDLANDLERNPSTISRAIAN
ncbi:MAG: RNA polymerase factor sigma-54, partial [Epsilonproteobacteria bacterium]|nr:RNA polymerase factor sigma-54 [Campylobacterota bacterium]